MAIFILELYSLEKLLVLSGGALLSYVSTGMIGNGLKVITAP
jgi:hypothetical protein